MRLILVIFSMAVFVQSFSQNSTKYSAWEFGSKFGVHFVNNFSLELGYGIINSEGYSGFEIGTELQIRKELLLAPKLSYTFYTHFFDFIDPCFGVDALMFTDFKKIEPVIRLKAGLHLSAIIELSYGYNWQINPQSDFKISNHEISLIFRLSHLGISLR